ncbi:2'-5' RNA ligase family protein [Saccharopolyspora gloriosae]|uniref:2'-5' RNA ligase family protein n=1 Tax=Saccharopolyspora gloriosae TaxID=455344 RepID=A0A840NCH2_9PSEU|nr:hypothetical protein [Saccharopolyspora gloriosae]
MPGADALLRAVGERFPGAVRAGFPAHITVLHPFLPLSDVDDEVVAELAAMFARRGPLRVEFAVSEQRRHFDEGFVALLLEPDGPLRELTAELGARWDLRPYGGAYGEPDPHVTVALDVAPEQAGLIAEQAAGALPPPADLDEAWLVAFDGTWSLRARLPLAPGGGGQ